MHVSRFASKFGCASYAMFGFGPVGAAAARTAAERCWAICCCQERKPQSSDTTPSTGPDAARAVLSAQWSFSTVCCDLADSAALVRAALLIHELTHNGHMAVLLGAGTSAAPLMELARPLHGLYQPARIFVPALLDAADNAVLLGTTAATLFASVACRGFVGVDVGDIWSAIGGPGVGIAVHATVPFTAGRQTVLSPAVMMAVHQVEIDARQAGRLLVGVVMPNGWHLVQIDELLTKLRGRFVEPDPVLFGAHDPSAMAASVLLVTSGTG
jgi:hypothetical protein